MNDTILSLTANYMRSIRRSIEAPTSHPNTWERDDAKSRHVVDITNDLTINRTTDPTILLNLDEAEPVGNYSFIFPSTSEGSEEGWYILKGRVLTAIEGPAYEFLLFLENYSSEIQFIQSLYACIFEREITIDELISEVKAKEVSRISRRKLVANTIAQASETFIAVPRPSRWAKEISKLI